MDYRKALVTTQQERDTEKARIDAEKSRVEAEKARIALEIHTALEAKNILKVSRDTPGNTYWPEFFPGYYVDEKVELTVEILTEPTSEQARLIALGERTLPFTFDSEFGTQIGCDVMSRGQGNDKFYQIINRINTTVVRFTGLALLQVCKQISAECSQILYGENSFVFNTGTETTMRYTGLHEHDELEHFPHWIPGMPRENGYPRTSNQFNNAMNRMFDRDGFLPKFVARNPMLQFFHRIGPVNTLLLTKIKVEGQMKTLYNHLPEESESDRSLGFARFLPILTTVLKEACPNLRELTLYIEDKKFHFDYKESRLWDNDPYNKSRKSDEDRIDEVVERVVTTLDSLPSLNLMPHHCYDGWDNSTGFVSRDTFVDEWEKSVKWMKYVNQRARTQQIKRAGEVGIATALGQIVIQTTVESTAPTLHAQQASVSNSGHTNHSSGPSGSSSRGNGRGRGQGRGGRGRGGRARGRGGRGGRDTSH
ncbi:uncharacterized protein LY89DRAFT_758142 [Mollisia scopiformis]|uniref:Uncharacterized protein n=1 Tax=Mollisia scopiformis TaxID=149040 RepID=A0A194WV65_MOLSC|nr:uncharacterized protein LY89DRAFT_758142 [Mollisia scopiformis]KUJ11477.1 hypothetical protein LY89DRAFT_758142 [Mollisia scopiformis]